MNDAIRSRETLGNVSVVRVFACAHVLSTRKLSEE